MEFKDTKEIEELTKNIIDLFKTIDDKEKEANINLIEKENIQQDLLHEIELAELNAIELMGVAKRIKKNRLERRLIKDELALIKTIKGYTRKFIEKGIIAESEQLLKNIDTYKKNLQNRCYVPKILENLLVACTNIILDKSPTTVIINI